MRLRNIPGSREAVAADNRCVHTPEEAKGHWHEIFGNDHPVNAEVGMGKGRFIVDMALKYPDQNFVGIEMYESVLIRALQKLDRRKKAGEPVPENLRFIRMDARDMDLYFEKGEVDKIYLNFSDPWPKDRHAKRRLESRQFLARFDMVLAKEGVIEFKTDNEGLFDFALGEIEPAGWVLDFCTRDLHADTEAMKDNVMTEYEEKFSAKGNKIYKYIIHR